MSNISIQSGTCPDVELWLHNYGKGSTAITVGSESQWGEMSLNDKQALEIVKFLVENHNFKLESIITLFGKKE